MNTSTNYNRMMVLLVHKSANYVQLITIPHYPWVPSLYWFIITSPGMDIYIHINMTCVTFNIDWMCLWHVKVILSSSIKSLSLKEPWHDEGLIFLTSKVLFYFQVWYTKVKVIRFHSPQLCVCVGILPLGKSRHLCLTL